MLPPTWSHANPVDIIGDAPVQRYVDTLQALLADPDTGAILFAHAPTAIVRSDDIARACAPIVRQAAGRVMACWLGDGAVAEARRIFEEAGVADYETPEQAVRAYGMLDTYRRNQALLLEAPTASENGAPDVGAVRAVFEGVRNAGRSLLNEAEAKAVLAAYGIPTVRTLEVAPTAEAAVSAARSLGYPVALKIVSPQVTHKSDVGGVALDLRDESSLRQAAARMQARLRESRPGAELTGFSVQPMASRPQAVELIVGASVDPVFGPVLLFGQGGTAVEVLADRAIGLPPLNRVLARELVSRTRVARLLAGYRDHPPAKLDAIADVLIALSQLLADWPELAELDINPLWADSEGVLALDARIVLSKPGEGRAGASHFAIAPYPAELVQRMQWQGRPLVVRPIRPEDGPQHRAFIEQLAPEDLRLRFFSSRRDLPRSELGRLTQIDYEREMAFIAEREEAGGRRETLGVARAVCDPDNIEAEFAVIVRSDLKGQGLGHLLMQALVRHLTARGTQRMVGYVLRENAAMRELARSLGFTAGGPSGEAEVLRLTRSLEAA